VDKNGERLTDHLDWHVKGDTPSKKATRRKPASKK